jgi:hypothetical protein
MALTAIPVDKQSPFIGEACALCKQPFGPGDEIVICPEDATRHHVHCWRSYGNRCTAYGCTGQGIVDSETQEAEVNRSPRGNRANETKVQTLPARSFHCAQSCLLLSIAVAIILVAIGCFGLWAIADYIMIDVLKLPYREPLAGAALFLTGLSALLP